MELAEIAMNPARQRIFQYFCFMKLAQLRKSESTAGYSNRKLISAYKDSCG